MLRRREKWHGLILVLFTILAIPMHAAEEPSVPEPPKSDVPFLIHAGALTEIVGVKATEEKKKDVVTYSVQGATSSVRTPLAGPEFIILTQNLKANDIQLYRFEVRNGRREISFNEKKRKNNPDPLILSVFPVGKGVSKLRVDQSLERGEYCLTPDGSNDVFCFTIF